jgi:hypothetical protein
MKREVGNKPQSPAEYSPVAGNLNAARRSFQRMIFLEVLRPKKIEKRFAVQDGHRKFPARP